MIIDPKGCLAGARILRSGVYALKNRHYSWFCDERSLKFINEWCLLNIDFTSMINLEDNNIQPENILY